MQHGRSPWTVRLMRPRKRRRARQAPKDAPAPSPEGCARAEGVGLGERSELRSSRKAPRGSTQTGVERSETPGNGNKSSQAPKGRQTRIQPRGAREAHGRDGYPPSEASIAEQCR